MSAEASNQSAVQPPTPTAKTAGVFSWLTGSRSPTHRGTPGPAEVSTTTTTRSVQSNASGSPHQSGNVSPTGTASPANSRSGSRSPARRFVIPQLAMGGGGRFGPSVVMDMAPRTVYAQVDDDDDNDADVDTEDEDASASREMTLPPSVQIKTKTMPGTVSENQLEDPLVVRYTTTTTTGGGDNQIEQPADGATQVRYVAMTEGGDSQTTPPSPAGVRYITTTTATSSADGAPPPPASPVHHVHYIAKTFGSPARSPAAKGGVRYMSKTMAVDGGQRLVSPAGPTTPVGASGTSVRFFGSPMSTGSPQKSVHYVTRVVNGQSVQVPVPAGVPSHDHRVHYVTSTGATGAVTSTVSPASSTSSTHSASIEPHQHQHQHQHVRYIVKSATPPTSLQPNQVQYVTTKTVTENQAQAPTSVPLSSVVASTVANATLSPAHMTPASTLNLEGIVDGLPARHFQGIALTDTDSSDGEDFDVKMVFDIMLQKFVPVKKSRRRATTAAAGAVVVKTEADLEEKAPAPIVAAAEAEADSGNKGNGLAVAAAVGITAAAAVGAGIAATSNVPPMMKLDTVGTPKATVTTGSPSGPKKRTPSQTKRESSPRKFFASAAAYEAPRVPDQDVTLELDASPTQYAELRSPSNGPMDGSRLGHVGMLLKVRVCRWLLITLLSLAVIVFLMILFYKGVTLRKYQASEYSSTNQYDLLDEYNGYVGLIASLFSTPIELLIAIVVPIFFFSFVAKALLGPKLSPRITVIMFSLSTVLTFLLTNGFHGINVQTRVMIANPVIALTDLSYQLSALGSLGALAMASSNASSSVTEGGVGNAASNTVLKNLVASGAGASASTGASSTQLSCSNTVDYSSLFGTSALSAISAQLSATVSSYGFPIRTWQDEMLSNSLPEANLTVKLDKKLTTGSTSLLNSNLLPMRARTAANLFLHSVHISRDVFRWFNNDSSNPLGVQAAVNNAYSSAKAGGVELTRVNVAELLNLTTAGGNIVDEALATPTFLSQVQALYNKSLGGAANISRSDSSLKFTSVTLPNDYMFESVTSEIAMTKNFLSRRLTASDSAFVEDEAPTTETDVYYDLDIANDCGPNAGACEVRRTEYDALSNVYEPPTTIRAFALCNNSLGNDEMEIYFNGSQTGKPIAYSCNEKYDSGMLVVSVSSRIVGDALIEGPSTLVPRLVAGMATLKNPRKIYSLTVGKLTWPKTNLALKFHAACAAGVGKCTGLDYALTAALKNATETISALVGGNLRGAAVSVLEGVRTQDQEFLIVGDNYLPMNLISAFAYNETEATTKATKTSSSIAGYPLVTITKPLQPDTLFENDGDIVVAANFKSVSWKTTAARSGSSCSATVEARLNSVLNNHFYIERGVQSAYTIGMFFLLQDAVMLPQVALSTSLTTLRFASTTQFMEMHASIPKLNMVLTLIGCGLILIVSLVVAIRSARGKYSAADGGDGTYPYAPPESFARVKLDRALFPALILKRRVIDMNPSTHSTATNSTGSPSTKDDGYHGIVGGGEEGRRIDTFTVGELRLEHDEKEISVDVPYTK